MTSFQDFAHYHMPGLEADEVRFNVQIAVLSAAMKDLPAGFQYWPLGEPGHCVIRSPRRSILLGALSREECAKLARETKDLAYPGILGAGSTAVWFAEEAGHEGIVFDSAEPQRIHVLRAAPAFPGTDGAARVATVADAPLIFDWMSEFWREGVPHDPPPQREAIEKGAANGRYLFWEVAGEPVALAGIGRDLKTVSAIGSVYTLPGKRGRGYAGSVTAALCERIFAEGKKAVCLYTDLRNSYSNRCYAKIGFTPYCESWHYLRAGSVPA